MIIKIILIGAVLGVALGMVISEIMEKIKNEKDI